MAEQDVNVKEILKKYKGGHVIDCEADVPILKEYASTGMISFGLSCKSKQAEAILTPQGKWLLKQL